MAAAERGHEHESRHPVMTEDMISRLPARRDNTGYALIIRDGVTPVIARPAIHWHGRWYKWLTRPDRRRYQPPAMLPQAPAAPDDLAWTTAAPQPDGLGWDDTAPQPYDLTWDDTAPQPVADPHGLAWDDTLPKPDAPARHAWHNGHGQPVASNEQPRRSRAARAWHGTGGGS